MPANKTLDRETGVDPALCLAIGSLSCAVFLVLVGFGGRMFAFAGPALAAAGVIAGVLGNRTKVGTRLSWLALAVWVVLWVLIVLFFIALSHTTFVF